MGEKAERLLENQATWRVEVDGKVFYQSDLTFDDLDLIGQLAGRPNQWTASGPLSSPLSAMGILAALLRKVHPDLTWDAAVAEARGRSASWINALESVQYDDSPETFRDGLPDPKAAGRTTPGLSGAPSGTGGPQT